MKDSDFGGRASGAARDWFGGTVWFNEEGKARDAESKEMVKQRGERSHRYGKDERTRQNCSCTGSQASGSRMKINLTSMLDAGNGKRDKI